MNLEINEQNLSSINWHLMSIDETFDKLKTRHTGLTDDEAASRLVQYGENILTKEKGTSPLVLFISQFTSLLIIILIIAAAISAFIGNSIEAIAIIIIVILAGVLGFIQEYQADKAIESLRKMTDPYANVIRNGKEINIPSKDIVPGDILVLRTGDKVPADARLIEIISMKTDEASLTGESVPSEKSASILKDTETTIADRANMTYMGTSVLYGRGKAVVTATGMQTESGKIAGILQTTETRKTPLQVDLDRVGKMLGIFAIILAAVLSVFGILRGYEIVEMFVWGVALAVAVIPEALPAVVTISLALGVRRMSKRRALIRKLPAVETLGAITVICSDKTGTLTQDEMTVRKIYTNGKLIDVSGTGYVPIGEFFIDGKKINPIEDRDITNIIYAGILCSDTSLHQNNGTWEVLGDPTEGGILVAAAKAGINKDEVFKLFPRVNEIPFSSERKQMTTIHQFNSELHAFSKGAPEVILSSCKYISRNGERLPLTENERKEIMDVAHQMGENALRVLGIAEKILLPEETIGDSVEQNMTFLGLVGMIDPPRVEAKEAVKLCEQAGIRPIMITGDHKVTAVAVAKELGILKQGRVITGMEMEKLSDEELLQQIDSIDVYARIAPEHKMRIVNAFMNKNHVVAMTGDGVNDAPALKKADIGVAMGITGTDVSKEAADMILTDDNFASIVAAVEEGRSIFENIRKYLIFLLSGNMATVFAMVMALVLTLPLPLTAVQILFINFIMDGLIAIALGVELPEPGIMRRKPRNTEENILNKRVVLGIGSIGVWISLVTMFAFLWALNKGFSNEQAVTIFFLTLIFSRLFNGINCRSMETSVFKFGIFTNMFLLYNIIIALGLTFSVIYIPVLQKAFGTTPLGLKEIIVSLAASSTVLIMAELQKHFWRSFALRKGIKTPAI